MNEKKFIKIMAVIILAFIIILLIYVMMNVQTLSTHPCQACEKLGGYCVPDPRIY